MNHRFCRLAALLCALALLLCTLSFAAAEEDEDYDLDLITLEDIYFYGDVDWLFPIPLEDMDPVMVRLANKQMLLSKNDVPSPLVTMKARKANDAGENTNGGVRKASSAEMKLQGTCAEALVAFFEGAQADGVYLYLKSAYRSWSTQNTMYYNRLKNNGGKDDGWVQKPGASDHQTGLGCDIVSRAWREKSMNEKFADTTEAAWMKQHCAEYGFILRYPDDKQDITGINFEPWHFRYVGIPAATYIMENGLCLEEFHDQLIAAIDDFLARGGDRRLVEDFIQVSAE